MNKPKTHGEGSGYWNKRAPSFVDHASKTLYPNSFLKIMDLRRSWTVLDVGCGGGTLAIPLALKVKHITAVDFSEKMLEKLQVESDKKKIRNISTIKVSWEEDWERAGIGVHDIAIASRSLAVDDIQSALQKLNNAARRRVYISTIVGDGPFDRKIFDAIERIYNPSVDYIYIYNLLYQMGIHANINFIENEKEKKFENHEAALNSYIWMFQDLTNAEKEKLKKYLYTHLINLNGKWILDYKQNVKWAVIWWERNK
ncbi:MAG: class I SAM-dependent methyltransferase [Spirochaetes bacterium]|nr:class I SAM-dependent methyltransferase [Spirochaetota bacterium]